MFIPMFGKRAVKCGEVFDVNCIFNMGYQVPSDTLSLLGNDQLEI